MNFKVLNNNMAGTKDREKKKFHYALKVILLIRSKFKA